MKKIHQHFQNILQKAENLPDKYNFKIGETAKVLGVAQHVLRYWEKEFSLLQPEKRTNQQRLYTKQNIQILLLIQCLLYKEKFSIEGLRKHLPFYLKQLKLYQKKRYDHIQTKQTPDEKAKQLLKSISQLKGVIWQKSI